DELARMITAALSYRRRMSVGCGLCFGAPCFWIDPPDVVGCAHRDPNAVQRSWLEALFLKPAGCSRIQILETAGNCELHVAHAAPAGDAKIERSHEARFASRNVERRVGLRYANW